MEAIIVSFILVVLVSARDLNVVPEELSQICMNSPPWQEQCQTSKDPQARFIYDSKYVRLNGLINHYVDIGGEDKDRVYLFLHGQPTWSYLWRNVIKYIGGCKDELYPQYEDACGGVDLEPVARAVVPDLIGFGLSDKPPLSFDDDGMTAFNYTIPSHIQQLEAFIDTLGLGTENNGQELVLVLHDWGGSIGAGYLGRHPKNVAGVVCFECYIMPVPVGNADSGFTSTFLDSFNTVGGMDKIFRENQFLGLVNQLSIFDGALSQDIQRYYSYPFLKPNDRFGMWIFPQLLMFGDTILPDGTVVGLADELPDPIPEGTQLTSLFETFAATQAGRIEFFKTSIPKLFMTVSPGAIFPTNSVQTEMLIDLVEDKDSLTYTDLGQGLHFFQEDRPDKLGEELRKWDEAIFEA